MLDLQICRAKRPIILPSKVILEPVLAPDTQRTIKGIFRVILVFDLEIPGIVGAVEIPSPEGIVPISLSSRLARELQSPGRVVFAPHSYSFPSPASGASEPRP
jgi:hypothetical protein